MAEEHGRSGGKSYGNGFRGNRGNGRPSGDRGGFRGRRDGDDRRGGFHKGGFHKDGFHKDGYKSGGFRRDGEGAGDGERREFHGGRDGFRRDDRRDGDRRGGFGGRREGGFRGRRDGDDRRDGFRKGGFHKDGFHKDGFRRDDGERRPFRRDGEGAGDGERREFHGERRGGFRRDDRRDGGFRRDGDRRGFRRDDRRQDGDNPRYQRDGERRPFRRDGEDRRDFHKDGERRGGFRRDDRRGFRSDDGERRPFRRDNDRNDRGDRRNDDRRGFRSGNDRNDRRDFRRDHDRDDRRNGFQRDDHRRDRRDDAVVEQTKPIADEQAVEQAQADTSVREESRDRAPRDERPRERRANGRSHFDNGPRRNSDGTLTYPSQNPYTDPRPNEPRMPRGMEWSMLSKEERERLRGLSKEHAENIGLHILAAYALEEKDPKLALEHAKWAAHQASRIDFSRETLAFIAYRQGDYKLALREFRTAYRMNGFLDYLPFIADCERGVGNPKKAVEVALSDDAKMLKGEAKAEMFLVYAGALGDLGLWDKAIDIVHTLGRSKGLTGEYRMRAVQAEQNFLEQCGRHVEASALDGLLDRLELQYADADDDEETDDVVIDHDMERFSDDELDMLGISDDDAQYAPDDYDELYGPDAGRNRDDDGDENADDADADDADDDESDSDQTDDDADADAAEAAEQSDDKAEDAAAHAAQEGVDANAEPATDIDDAAASDDAASDDTATDDAAAPAADEAE